MAEEQGEYTFVPHTPREALLAIRAECRGIHSDSDPFEVGTHVDRLAEDGLRPSGPATYELTDQLAERLAEAHHILLGLKEGYEDAAAEGVDFFSEEVKAKFAQALALPPDLEAMIELRWPRG